MELKISLDFPNIENKCGEGYVERILCEMRGLKCNSGRQGLLSKLDYLDKYSDRATKCVLRPDNFNGRQDFNFTMQIANKDDTEWKVWFNGGLIHHGNGEWGIHT